MKLFKSTALVSGLTLTSRLFGFVRESIMARYFGASAANDAFLVAFRLPNMLRQLFSEGAFATAFVPVLSNYKANRTPEEKRELINHVAGTLAAILLVVASIGVLLAPVIVWLVAPGYHDKPAQRELTIALLRVTFPYIFFVSLCGLSAGILNTHGRFAVPALTPILLNVAMIVGALVAHRFAVPIHALAWSVLAGGLVQLLIQIPALWRLGLLPKPTWGWKHSGVQRVLKLMVPTMFGASVAQVNLLVDVVIATWLVAGSVTWLSNADRLLQFPQGVFGVALSAVILPHLSGKFAKKDGAGFSQSLDWALRMSLIISIPAMLSLAILAEAVMLTVFGYGKYTPHDAYMAGFSLMGLACGLPAFIAIKVLAPGFFSRQDTRTPVKAAVASMLSNIVLNGIFVGGLYYGKFRAPHMGMSIASALAAYLNAGLLLYWLKHSKAFDAQSGWVKFFIQLSVAACALMGVLLVGRYLSHVDQGAFAQLRASMRFAWIIGILGVGAVVYLGTLWLAGLNPRQLLDRHEQGLETPRPDSNL
jgi:putative peptidoglycan lipid II flippase